MDKLDKSLDEIMASEHRRPAKPKPKPKPAGSGGAPKPGPSSSLASRIGPKVKVNAAGASKAVASAIKSNSEGQAKGGGKAPSAKKGKARAEPYSVTSRVSILGAIAETAGEIWAKKVWNDSFLELVGHLDRRRI